MERSRSVPRSRFGLIPRAIASRFLNGPETSGCGSAVRDMATHCRVRPPPRANHPHPGPRPRELPTFAPQCAVFDAKRGTSGQLAETGRDDQRPDAEPTCRPVPGRRPGGAHSALQPASADLDWVEVVEICHTFACPFLAKILEMQVCEAMRFSLRRAVAQLVEQRSPKPQVAGSSPVRPATRSGQSARKSERPDDPRIVWPVSGR